jgi:hypothetical protein
LDWKIDERRWNRVDERKEEDEEAEEEKADDDDEGEVDVLSVVVVVGSFEFDSRSTRRYTEQVF